MATKGWPVTPGAWLRAGRFHCGRPGCLTVSCHPARSDWETAASTDPAQIMAWWRHAPHSVLLATGYAFDVLELPAPLGDLVIHSPGWSGTDRGPVATTPTGRWMFLVRPGAQLGPELAGRMDVIWHARGSWVPAPPTHLTEGRVRWTVSPAEVGWRLPDGQRVQDLLADALVRLPTAPSTVRPGPIRAARFRPAALPR